MSWWSQKIDFGEMRLEFKKVNVGKVTMSQIVHHDKATMHDLVTPLVLTPLFLSSTCLLPSLLPIRTSNNYIALHSSGTHEARSREALHPVFPLPLSRMNHL